MHGFSQPRARKWTTVISTRRVCWAMSPKHFGATSDLSRSHRKTTDCCSPGKVDDDLYDVQMEITSAEASSDDE